MDHAASIRFCASCLSLDRVHVIATDALPEDSRITRPMIVVHIVDSSTGRYLRRAPPPKVKYVPHATNKQETLIGDIGCCRSTSGGTPCGDSFLLQAHSTISPLPWFEGNAEDKMLTNSHQSSTYFARTPLIRVASLDARFGKADTHSEPSPERSRYDETDGDETHHNMKHAQGHRKHQKQRGAGTLGAGNALAEAESARLVFGGATTTFEERTVWNFVDVSSKVLRVPVVCLVHGAEFDSGSWMKFDRHSPPLL